MAKKRTPKRPRPHPSNPQTLRDDAPRISAEEQLVRSQQALRIMEQQRDDAIQRLNQRANIQMTLEAYDKAFAQLEVGFQRLRRMGQLLIDYGREE